MPFFKRKISRTVVQTGWNNNSIFEESRETFTRTIQIWQQPSHLHSNHFKAVLDAGCLAGNLISSEVVAIIGCQDQVHPSKDFIGMCLHGHPLRSTGTVVLEWESVGFYKVFETRFHVIEGDSLPWQVILGANTCANHNLLTVGAGAFGGSNIPVFPKGKKDKAKEAIRFQKHKEEVAANAARVERHENEKAQRAQQRGAASGAGGGHRDEFH